MSICPYCNKDSNKFLQPITKEKLLLVEGNDEVCFFNKYLPIIDITDVQVIEVGGKEQFRTKLPTLKLATSNFSNIVRLAIIRDADDNAENAFRSVKGVLSDNGLPIPLNMGTFSEGTPKAGIFIMPDNTNIGMLEDLCLSTITEQPYIDIINAFMSSTQSLGQDNQPKNTAKAKVQVYLASKPNIVSSIGKGTDLGYWNLTSSVLESLKNFLLCFKS